MREVGSPDNSLENELSPYFSELRLIPRLSLEELECLWDIVSEGGQNAEEAKTKLALSNLRLVVRVAKRYADKNISLADLIQEGNIGLLKAIEKFDHKKGFKFSTYATWWIRASINRYLLTKGNTIRVPESKGTVIRNISKSRALLFARLGNEPTTLEIANFLEMPIGLIEECLSVTDPISLDLPLDNGEGSDGAILEKLIPDTNAVQPDEAVIRAELRDAIQQQLQPLGKKSKKVLMLQYGIPDEGEPEANALEMSQSEIAEALGLTRQRINQIYFQALERLRLKGHRILKQFNAE